MNARPRRYRGRHTPQAIAERMHILKVIQDARWEAFSTALSVAEILGLQMPADVVRIYWGEPR